VIPVDLFGQSADHDGIGELARAEGLVCGGMTPRRVSARLPRPQVGRPGRLPPRPVSFRQTIGLLRDGGAIFTDDDDLANILRSIRVHGQGIDKYDNIRLGMTGRLDTIQAAVLIEKLKIFDDEIAARSEIADRYGRGLGNDVIAPHVASGNTSVWAQ